MSPRLRKILIGLAYSSWFLFLFVLLTWFTFPWSRVRDQAIVQAHDAGWELRIDSLGSAVVGLKGKGIALAKASGDDEAPNPDIVALDKVKVKTGVAGALATGLALRGVAAEGGTTPTDLAKRILDAAGAIDVKAKLYGGKLDARMESEEEVARFSLAGEDLDLAKYVLETDKFSADPRGELQADADVTWHWEDPKKTSGAIDLVIDDMVISGLKIGIFGLPETAFSRSEAHVKFTRGKAELRDTEFEADEVQVVVEGFVTLSKNVMRSRLSLKVRFKLREDLDQLAKVALGANPAHKDDDGWFHYQLNGTLQRPRFRSSPASVRAAKRGSTPSRRSTRRDQGDDDDDDDLTPRRTAKPRTGGEKITREGMSDDQRAETEEERERLREERLQRREERRQRREELMRRRRERQADLDGTRSDGRVGTTQDFELQDEVPRTNFPEDEEEELEEELEEEVPEGEFEEVPEGEFDVEPDVDFQD